MIHPQNASYIAKLQQRGLLSKFIDNCNNVGTRRYENSVKIPADTYWDFISRAFFWEPSPEGYSFWKEIAKDE